MMRPPATLTLEEEEMRFYAAIGKTMMQWQTVEVEYFLCLSRAAWE